MIRSFCVLIPLVCLPVLAGCGGQKVGKVHGKVTYEGQPVTTGSITFVLDVPKDQFEGGKPGVGEVQPDGSYQLSTYTRHDGALVGKHRVTYTPPSLEGGEEENPSPERVKAVRMYGNLGVPTTFTAEVQPGDNEIVIKLTRVQ